MHGVVRATTRRSRVEMHKYMRRSSELESAVEIVSGRIAHTGEGVGRKDKRGDYERRGKRDVITGG